MNRRRQKLQPYVELEHQLITNTLPKPKLFDAHSEVAPTAHHDHHVLRKDLPPYLREGLPPLKYYYIRQQFKEISQIGCPHLQYFNDKIKGMKQVQRLSHSQRNHSHHHSSSRQQNSTTQSSARTKNNQHKRFPSSGVKKELAHVRQTLKYTLLTSDPQSNVILQLIRTANTLQQQLFYEQKKTHPNHSHHQHPHPKTIAKDSQTLQQIKREISAISMKTKEKIQKQLKEEEQPFKTITKYSEHDAFNKKSALTDLLSKENSKRKKTFYPRKKYREPSTPNLPKSPPSLNEEDCFPNTLALVLAARKESLLVSLEDQKPKDTPQQHLIKQKILAIELEPYC